MLKRKTTTALFALMTAFCGISHAATQTVGTSTTNCPAAKYSTIAAAISAAGPGDEVDVCPGLYPEQLVIAKPLTLKGIAANGVGRILVQPTALAPVAGMPAEAVITVMNTRNVTIQNLAIDASNNTLTGCGTMLSGIQFYNSTGSVQNNAILGAKLQNPANCTVLYPGTGFGVLVNVDGNCGLCRFFPFQVSVDHNSIHDFGRDGILATGAGASLEASDNTIVGVGPSTGVFQFGIFLSLGVVGRVTGNFISQEGCGSLSDTVCLNTRSEGVVLLLPADGTVIDSNVITKAQFGLFLNGGNAMRITNNVITDIDSAGSGIQMQAITNSLIEGNKISGVGPINQAAVDNHQGCGIREPSLVGAPAGAINNSGNTFQNNTIGDAYCGIAYVTGDEPQSGTYYNTLYTTLNTDQRAAAGGPPPPTEP